MTQDEIIEMAKQAWISEQEAQLITEFDMAYISCTYLTDLVAFAKLVATKERKEMAEHCVEITRMAVDKAVASAIEKEREACAKMCDDLDDDLPDGLAGWQYGEAIRARGEA